jgi:hypothetical protein
MYIFRINEATFYRYRDSFRDLSGINVTGNRIAGTGNTNHIRKSFGWTRRGSPAGSGSQDC